MQMRSESNNHNIYREKRRSRKSGLDTHTHTQMLGNVEREIEQVGINLNTVRLIGGE